MLHAVIRKALVLCITLAAAGYLAQGASAQQPGGAPAAQNEAVDEARLAAARDLLRVTGSYELFDTMTSLVFRSLSQQLLMSNPKIGKELAEVIGETQKLFRERKDELIEQIARIYAERFAADELKAVADFYRSPTGQKFVAALPELTRKGFQIGEEWGKRIGLEAEEKVREELRKRGIKL